VERLIQDYHNDDEQSELDPSRQQDFLAALVERFDLKAASNNSKFGMCPFCFVVQTANSAYLKEHLVVVCLSCPDEVKCVFAESVSKSKGRCLVSKRKALEDLAERAAAAGLVLNICDLNINNATNSRSSTSTSRSSTASSAAERSRAGGRHTADFALADTHFSRCSNSRSSSSSSSSSSIIEVVVAAAAAAV
jgi:hypothetical protein